MAKLLNRLGRIILSVIGLLVLFIVLVLLIDTQRTAFLRTKKQPFSSKNTYLITNVKLVPMTSDTVLTNQTVVVKNGMIEAVGAFPVDVDVPVFDAQGAYLMPGLIDMHVHVWDKYELGLYLANGVTAIRNVWGMPMHLRLKRKIIKGKIVSPAFFTTGPKLTGPEFIGSDNLQLFSPEEARTKVKDYKKRGYDFIKSYNGLPEDIFDAILEQAKLSDMDVVAHPSHKVPYSYHFREPIVTLEHAEDIVQQPLNYKLDTAALQGVVAEFANAPHSALCPTLMAFYNIYNMIEDDSILYSETVKYMNPAIQMLDSKAQFTRWQSEKSQDPKVGHRIKEQHEFHLYAIQQLNNAGVNIVCGTDAGIGVTVPGHSIHKELAFYKKAGLTNYQVLRTATANVAKTHAVMQNMGTIEKGKVASFILVKENPLDNIAAIQNPEAVFVNGYLLDNATLKTFTTKARNRKNLLATVLHYAENSLKE